MLAHLKVGHKKKYNMCWKTRRVKMISARDASSSKNESQEEIYHVLGDVETEVNISPKISISAQPL